MDETTCATLRSAAWCRAGQVLQMSGRGCASGSPRAGGSVRQWIVAGNSSLDARDQHANWLCDVAVSDRHEQLTGLDGACGRRRLARRCDHAAVAARKSRIRCGSFCATRSCAGHRSRAIRGPRNSFMVGQASCRRPRRFRPTGRKCPVYSHATDLMYIFEPGQPQPAARHRIVTGYNGDGLPAGK
jgi:hypothetical protein